jgi:hypothetical protein
MNRPCFASGILPETMIPAPDGYKFVTGSFVFRTIYPLAPA